MSAPALRVSRAHTPEDLAAGINIAAAAKQTTGYPLDADEPTLRTRLAERQQGAAAVWLAHLPDGTPVGHALVTYVGDTHPLWGRVNHPTVRRARFNGTLLELGGLSVHPNHHNQGIATILTQTRLAWAHEHNAVPVSCNWNNSPGSAALGRRHGTPIGSHPDHPITLHLLHPHATNRQVSA